MLKVILIAAMLLSACSSELAVNPSTSKMKKPIIDNLNKVTGKAGDEISFFGQNLTADMDIIVGGVPATFILDDKTKGSFVIPAGAKTEDGLMHVQFSVKNKNIVTFPVVDSDKTDAIPIVPVPEENVCTTLVYKNEAGELVRGKANCSILAACSENGETECWTSDAVPAVPKIDLEAKLASGVSFGAITGTACSVDDSPLATLAGQPVGSSNGLVLNVTVAGTDITHYKYKLRESTDAPCSDVLGYSVERSVIQAIDDDITALADGSLQLCVIGKDTEGVWQAENHATTASWTKDTVAPTAVLANAPSGTNNSSSLNVAVSGPDVTQYKYKIRDAVATLCSDSTGYSPAVAVAAAVTDSLASLADGAVEICVVGGDAAGNWQDVASATNASWTKDTQAPSATISGAPTATNNTTILSVTVAGADVSHYKYKIRTTAQAFCSSAADYSAEVAVATPISNDISALSDGALELCVIGRDAYGNWQSESTAATASWTKDALPPVAVLSGAPTGTSLSTALSISVGGTDVVEYKYKIREAADPACSHSGGYSAAVAVANPIADDISSKADGALDVCVIGKDSTGNWQLEGTATIASWSKDTTAPAASISNAPTGTNNTTVLDVTIAGTDVTAYRYKVRVTADAACSVVTGYSAEIPVSTKIASNISSLSDGAVELCVIGRDAAGNWQALASSSTASWTKDATAPTATISGQPTGTNNAAALNVTVAGAGVSHFKYKIRETADVACSNSSGYSTEVAVGTAITNNIASLADGSLELCVIGRDASGNWQAEVSATTASWTKDSSAPTAVLSGVPTGTSLSSVLAIAVSGAGVVEYKYKIRETSDGICSNSSGYSSAIAVATPITDDISSKADGALEVCVIGKDSAGNWQLEASATTASWSKDTTAPTASISDAPSATNNVTVLDVTIAGTDVTHYKFKIRESADAACSVAAGYSAEMAVTTKITDTISALADGAFELCVIGRDAAGNWKTEASATVASWIKDTAAPTALLSGEPSGTNAITALNVAVSGSDVTHYKFKVRGTSDAACSNAAGYSSEVPVATALTSDISAMADGAIELCVIGRDATGNWQTEGSATTASWTKDALPPAATLSGQPSGTSLATSLNITVGPGDVIEYKYKIRVSTDSGCANSSGYSSAIAVGTPITDDISSLADGVIQVCAIGKDGSGNWQLEGVATAASWTKDTSAPTASISNAPSSTNLTTVLDVTVSGTDVTHYKYKIREAADSACSVATGYSAEVDVATKISSNISALSDGVIELCVIGRDAAGNWQADASATTASWTKDTTAPTATVSGEPTGTNNTTALNVTVAGSGVSHYKFKIRETSDAACSNAAGYSSEIAVATAITSNISPLGDGMLELCVIGRDAIGNWQAEASATTVSWTKDALPPIASLSGQPTGTSLATSLNITVAGTDVVEYKYKLRESTDSACSDGSGYGSAVAVATPITNNISSLADGVIQVCVIGKDASGNWQLEGTAASASWTKDTSAPTATVSNAPSATNNATVLDVTVAGTDVSHYKYKIRESADAACSAASGYSSEVDVSIKITSNISALADGTLELCVIGRDAAGNWQAEASATTTSWAKDTTAPSATISGEPTGTNSTTALNVTVAGSDVTHYKFKVRETSDAACSNASGYSSEVAVATPITSDFSGLSDGVIELCVIGRDASGNWQAEASATTASWTKDALPPVASLSGQPSGTSLSTSLDITVGGADVVEYKYKIREASDLSCSNSTGYSSATAVATHITNNISALADGVIQVCVIAKDASGNWQLEGTATAASWTKDTAAPTATIANAPAATNNTTLLDVTIAGPDVTHYKYKLREAASTACSNSAGYSAETAVGTKITSDISSLSDGAIELCVVGRDAAGNWQPEASAATASWTKDTAAPTATVSGEPTGTNNNTVLNVTVAGTDVTHYKFKVRETSDPACSNATGYSSEAPVATAITSNFSTLSDGVIELCVIGRDAYGNWQAEASATVVSWTKDALPPAATLSGQPTGNSLATSLNITVAGTDVVEYKYKIRETADLSCSNASGYSSAIAVATPITDSISALADGAIQVCVIAKDASGNWQLEGTATTASWTKDTQAPTASIADQPSGTNGTTTLNVTVAGTDVTHYKYKVRESATTACSNSSGYSVETAIASKITDSISALADGAIELCVIGRDAAGNWQSEASATTVNWTKDTTAPTASISGEPTGTNATTSLNVTIAGSDVTHYKFKIRESADVACSDSAGYSVETAIGTKITSNIASLADGTIQFCVVGKDSSGNWQAEASATTASWTKDTTAPVASISGAPGASSNVTSLDITVAGTDVVEYKYKIRATADSACSVGTGYSSAIAVSTHITDNIAAKAEGAIEVCVIGKDSSGNWQAEVSATTANWTKDTTAPTASLSDAPAGTNNAGVLDVTVAGTGVTHYKYKLRESADAACSAASGYSSEIAVATKITNDISAYADGALELCVIGRDAAGNWQSEASATVANWTKDTTAPTATISAAPSGTNNTTTLNATVAGTGVTHYKYKIRESADAACSSTSGYSSEIAVATAITDSISAKADGALELCVIGRDASGNWQAEASATTASWTKDTNAPTATISGNPTGSSLVTSLDLTIGGTGVTEYKYKIRDAADSACSVSSGYSAAVAAATHITDSISGKADGAIEVCVIAKDSIGNWQLEASASTVTWTKDTHAPTASISGAPTGTNNTAALNITVAGTGVTEYKYKIRESATTACSNSAGYSSAVAVATTITDGISSFADGAMEICVIGRDTAGNWQAEASATTATWTKDTTAPTATLSGSPSGTDNTVTLNVTVAGTSVSHYKYKIRESADAACSNSSGYSAEVAVGTAITDSISGKADGTLELCVIGRDSVGNWQAEASATTASWTKDTAAPTALISGNPTGSSLTTSLNITISGTDVVEYKYKIRATADSACSVATGYSSATALATHITSDISAKADGTIEVCVIGKDAQGNWQAEASATTATWTKDTVAPTATISAAPTGTNNSTALNITVAGTGVTEYKYKIRGSATTACSVTTGYSSAIAVATAVTDSISGFADGAMEVCVIGRDAAGNWQAEASATSATWTKDTTAPTASLSGQPTATSNTTVLNATVAGSAVTHYKYKIRESADAACSSTSGYSSETAVATAITDNIAAKADGSFEICVIGRDASGNWQAEASATSATWTKDTVAPTAAIAGHPTGTNLTTTLDITIAGTDVTEYKYKVRATADSACSVSTGYSSAVAVATHITSDISAKADGAIEVCVIGKDSAGNWQAEASATTVSWTKDTTAPSATIAGNPTGSSNATSLNVAIAGTGVTEYKYKIRGSATTACSVTTGYSAAIAVATGITDSISGFSDGAMEICVVGRDAAGNWQAEASATSVTWTKDTAAPTATLSGQPSGTNNTTTLNVIVAGTGVTDYKYKVRESADAACSSASGYSSSTAVATAITDSISTKADGTLELCVIGRDAAGNWQAEASATAVTWTKDTVAPTASISGHPAGTNLVTTLDITIAGTGVVEYKYKIRATADTACSVTTGYSSATAVATHITDSITAKADGTIEVCVIGKDGAGNWQTEAAASTVTWTKDTTAPSATIAGNSTGSSNATTLNVTIAGTGVVEYKYKLRESATTACSDSAGYSGAIAVATGITDSISSLADGAIEICAVAKDAAGNWQAYASATSATWTKDTAAPTATLSGQPTGTNNTTTLNVTVAGTGVSHYKYKIRVSADAACSNSSGYSSEVAVATAITDSISAKADGTIELCLIGRDASGNWQTEATATAAGWTKDTVAPTATISGNPTGTSLTTTLDITIAGTGVVEYKYKIRATADTACSVSTGYSSATAVATHITDSITAKADGTIEVCVIGKDSAGNWQLEASATSVTWTKDTTAPTATISGSPTGTNNTTTLNVTIAGTDVTEYKYKIRQSASTACSNTTGYSSSVAVANPITDSISGLTDGTIEICVVGRDSAGNWQAEASATAVSWTKDTAAPTATVAGAPTGTNNTVTLDVTVAGTGVVEYKYKVRASGDTTCSNSSGYSSAVAVATHITDSISAKADGAMEVCVIGKDSAGNWQLEASATSATWTKDTTAPTATVSGAPSGTSTDTVLDVTVAGTGVTHYKYKIRASADSACSNTSGYSSEIAVATHITDDITAKADGAMEICVIGRDSVGNYQLESVASSATWTKAAAAPTASISGQPSGTSRTTTLSVTVGGTGVTHYKYKIRDTSTTACSDSTGYTTSDTAIATLITDSISAKADGTIEICVVGRGASGVYQAYADATSATWTKDATAPTAPSALLTSPRENGAKVTWTSGGGDTAGFIVLRYTATNGTAPTGGSTYTAGGSVGSSTVAYVGTNTYFTSSGLGTTKYYYKVFAYDSAKNYSTGVEASLKGITYEPPSADSLLLWTDASYMDSLFQNTACSTAVTGTTGQKVACLKDISLKTATFTQATSTAQGVYRPTNINSKPSINFAAAQKLIASSTSIPSGNLQHSLVYIGSFGTTTTSNAIHIGNTSAGGKINLVADSSLIQYAFGSNDLRYTPPTTSAQLYVGTYDGVSGQAANKKFFINGIEEATASTSGTLTNTLNLPSNPAVAIGSNSAGAQYLTGDVGEFLLYDHDLSSTELSDLSKYAWDKWAIPQAEITATTLLSGNTLNWVDGTDSPSYLLVKKAGSAPATAPTNGVAYSAGGTLGGDSIIYSGSARTYTDSASLVQGTTYYYALYVNDGSYNYRSAVTTSVTVLATPALTVASNDTKLDLSWSAVSTASGYLVVRKTSSAPTFTPTNGTTYTAGTVVGSDTIVYVGTSNSYQNTGLTNGTAYYYKLFAYDANKAYASPTSDDGTPVAPCAGGTVHYRTSTAGITTPANCTSLTVKAWGGGGAGAPTASGATGGKGGAGGYASSTFTMAAGNTVNIKIGLGGTCAGVGGNGYATGTSASSDAGGGAATANAAGSAGGGSLTGGTGSTSNYGTGSPDSSLKAGGNGKTGGGGGGSGSTKGGGGGGATAVTVNNGSATIIIAGGGGGGGYGGNGAMGGNGGTGCSQNAGSGYAAGSGGGGACQGTTKLTGTNLTPGNSADATTCGSATSTICGKGGTGSSGSCAAAQNGTDGGVTLIWN